MREVDRWEKVWRSESDQQSGIESDRARIDGTNPVGQSTQMRKRRKINNNEEPQQAENQEVGEQTKPESEENNNKTE